MASRISLHPIRLEHSLPRIHLETESSIGASNIPSIQDLQQIRNRQRKQINDLKKKIQDNRINIKFISRRVNYYRNIYRENKYMRMLISYNLDFKDQETEKLRRELRRYGTHIV
jgi:hypothetical protein